MAAKEKRYRNVVVAGILVLVFALHASVGSAASAFSTKGTSVNSVYYGIRG